MFEVATPGFRYHMSNLNAAIGLAQLQKLDRFVARRRAICRRYDEAFAEMRGICPLRIDYTDVAPHIYVIRVGDGQRDTLAAWLKEKDIETGIHYVPNHFHPLFKNGARLPNTEQAFVEILTLPLHCDLTDLDIEFVIQAVGQFLAQERLRA